LKLFSHLPVIALESRACPFPAFLESGCVCKIKADHVHVEQGAGSLFRAGNRGPFGERAKVAKVYLQAYRGFGLVGR
jgi:hypothetical protein